MQTEGDRVGHVSTMEKDFVISSGKNIREVGRDITKRFISQLGRKIILGIITTLVIFVTFFVLVPVLSQKEVLPIQQLIQPGLSYVVAGIVFGVYLSLLRSVEEDELARYITTLVLGTLLVVLPFLNIWQLKYGYDPVEGVYKTYSGPPLIPEGWAPIVNPIWTSPLSESYLDGVKGYRPFIDFGALLILIAGLLTIVFSIRFIRLERTGRLKNYEDDFGTLSRSQESYKVHFRPLPTLGISLLFLGVGVGIISLFGNDVFWTLIALTLIVFSIYFFSKLGIALHLTEDEYLTAKEKKKLRVLASLKIRTLQFRLTTVDEEVEYSLNRIAQLMGAIAILGIIFVFLGLEGFIGMETFLSEAGFYVALVVAMHITYLTSDPDFRFRLHRSKLAYGFVMPTVVMLIFELYIPILVALYLSFQDIRKEPIAYYNLSRISHNVGFENYEFLINADLIWIAVIFFGSTALLIRLWRFAGSFKGNMTRKLSQLLLLINYIQFLLWSIGIVLIPRYEAFIERKSSLFIDPSPIPVFVNTIVWTFASVISHLIIGITLALLMNTEFKGRGIVRSLMIIPWAVPNFITISIFAAFIFDTEAGAVNIILRLLHLTPYDWMASDNILWTSILVNIWLGYPFIMVAILAALQSIPNDIYEAAELDGATRWTKFYNITLPLIKPTVFVVSLLGFLWTFNLFNVIYLITLDKLSVLSVEDYYILIVYIFAVFRGGNWSIAATFSFVLFLLVAAFSWIYAKAVGKGPYEI